MMLELKYERLLLYQDNLRNREVTKGITKRKDLKV